MIRWSAQYLAERDVENARLNAEYLLGHVLGCDRMALYLQFDRPLDSEELGRYRPLLLRRAGREPLQYILGTAAFRELELAVDPRVLIPRPETEELVGAVLDWASDTGREGATALDLGTGSGAIALSLAREGRFSLVVAVDSSPDALDLARANESTVRDHVSSVDTPNGSHDTLKPPQETGVSTVEFLEGDLFAPLGDRRFDVVVSNPPYLAESERAEMQPEVLDHEPVDALFAGADGLDIIRRLLEAAPKHLNPGGLLAVEIGAEQGASALDLARQTEGLTGISIRQDLAGRDRILLAERE
jgi:release factor glutamine methyltransferase